MVVGSANRRSLFCPDDLRGCHGQGSDHEPWWFSCFLFLMDPVVLTGIMCWVELFHLLKYLLLPYLILIMRPACLWFIISCSLRCWILEWCDGGKVNDGTLSYNTKTGCSCKTKALSQVSS